MKVYSFQDCVRLPFIAMLHTEDGERKVFGCDFPKEFIDEFKDINIDVFKVFIMGNETPIKSKEEIIKFCNG